MPIFFFFIALLYASVGMGGGSSYIALLALAGVDYTLLPSIALICNLIVVSGGSWHFIRRGHFDFNLFWPLAIGSMPCAYLGGRLPVSEPLFLALLGVVLVLAGGRLLVERERRFKAQRMQGIQRVWGVGLGAVVGFLAGMVGIGGGIFLAPLLLNLRWASPRKVAALCAVFILLNSIAGLLGQWTKSTEVLEAMPSYLLLFLAVWVGGQLGSRLGSRWIPQLWLRRMTGGLVLLVGVRILWLRFFA